MAQERTVVSAFLERARELGDQPLWYEVVDGRWSPTTWGEAAAGSAEIACGLIGLGVQPGGTVGLLGLNRPTWVTADYGIQMAGAVTVPLYASAPPLQWADILQRARAAVCLVDGEALLERLVQERTSLDHIVALHLEAVADPRVVALERFRSLGESWRAAHPRGLAERQGGVGAADPATVIFTSGTTGAPKAVVLTHANLVATANAAVTSVGTRSREVLLSYLPLSHVFERLITTVCPLVAPSRSWTAWFVPDLDRLPAALRSVRPTITVGVPLFWHRLRGRILAEYDQPKGLRHRLQGRLLRGAPRSGSFRPISLILRALLALSGRRILGRLGLGRCWLAISGAAPLDAETQRFFAGLGLPIHQGWGLTETTGLAAVQRPGDVQIGVVGPPLQGVEIRVDGEGEVLVRGPNVFLGYLDEPPPGSPEVDSEGFLHTRDFGEMEQGEKLRIIERRDDMIVTAGGRKVAPRQIEQQLTADPLIQEAMVLGDGRPYLVALLELDPRGATRFLTESGGGPVWEDPAIQARVADAVTRLNESLPVPDRIQRWRILPLGFPDEALTPTFKIRRRVVEDLLDSMISALYE